MHSPASRCARSARSPATREFNEVFLENVRVPAANILGVEGQGWQVGITTLMYERLGLGFGLQARFEIATGATLELARRMARDGQPAAKDPVMRQRLAQLVIDNAVFKYTAKRAITKLLRGEMPGSEASAGKIWWCDRHQALQDLAQELLGSYGQLSEARPGPSTAATGTTRSSAPGPTRSRAARPTSSATSWPSASSACRRTSPMDFGFSQEQELLRQTARSFLEKECPSGFVRRMMDEPTGTTDDFGRKLAELGWLGLDLSRGARRRGPRTRRPHRRARGDGARRHARAVLLDRAPGRAGDPPGRLRGPAEGVAPRIAAGRGAGDARPPRGERSLGRPGRRRSPPSPAGGGFVLSGTKLFVPDGHTADLLVVAARTARPRRTTPPTA